MPRDANGNTAPLPGTIVSQGDTILPSQHNPALVDIYSMITGSLSRDGQGGMRAPLDMSGLRIINVAPGVATTDAATMAQINALDPLGIPKPYLGAAAPTGYVFCFGQAISRVTFSTLFAVLGTTYGAGDGSTTFNIPDFRGRSLSGKDDMGGTAANRLTTAGSGVNGIVLGASGGLETHTLTVPQMPTHNHAGGTTDLQGLHDHAIPNVFTELNGGPNSGVAGDDDMAGQLKSRSVGSAGIHGHNLSIPNNGGGLAHNNVQPTIVTNWILRTGI